MRDDTQDGQAVGDRRPAGSGRRGGSPGEVAHNYDGVAELVAASVERTKGRITAKRLLPVAAAAGYGGSARNFRRLVADAKAAWRAKNHRGRRPGVWAPGDVVVFDWGEIGPLFVFCAVLAWSRVRFVSFADNLGAEATMAALAECFEAFGGVPRVALTDRMGCLKGGTVAGLVIPTPAYVRFATHYGFRPDFCEGADPEIEGAGREPGRLRQVRPDDPRAAVGGRSGRRQHQGAGRGAWRSTPRSTPRPLRSPPSGSITEQAVLGALPSLRAQIGKIVIRKVDRLSCVRFGSARYSVPNEHVGAAVELRVRDGVITVVRLGEIIAEHLRRRPRRDLDPSTSTTAVPDRPRRGRSDRKAQQRQRFVRSARPPTRSSKAPPPTA